MKTFENKQTSITMSVEGTTAKKDMTFADLAILTLNIPPKTGGWPREVSRLHFKIEDKLTSLKVDESVELEDTEFEKVHALSAQDWQFKHRDTIAYEDHLDEMAKKKE